MTPAALDYLVLTASSAAQARGYHAQLDDRGRRGELPGVRRWLVIPDSRDRRIGSGGSTINVLFELARRLAASHPRAGSLAELFETQRILIIHSGGDSRRLPAYAAQGKIFTPLPRATAAGRPADLFDLVFEDLAAVVPEAPGRVIIAAGDLFLGLADARPDLARPGVVGVAVPGSLERASRHGVYIAESAGRVTDFLQKPSPSIAHERGAVDATGEALIDTGVVGLDSAAIERFLLAAGAGIGDGRAGSRVRAGEGLLADIRRGVSGAIDLYEQVLMALPPQRSRESYLDAVAPAARAGERERRVCQRLYDGLHGLPFGVAITPRCEFVHIGTSREFLAMATSDPRLRDGPPHPLTIYHSRVRGASLAAGLAVIEACELPSPLKLGGDNILTGLPVLASDAPALRKMPRGLGLVCLPVGPRGWAAVVFGVDDDGKSVMESGGTFANVPLSGFLRRARLTEDELWPDRPGTPRTLWNARLWRAGATGRVMADAKWFLSQRGPAPRAWRRGPRMSLAQLLPLVNHDRLIEHRRDLQRRERLETVVTRLRADAWMPAAAVADDVRTPAEAREAVARISAAADAESRAGRSLEQARLLRAAAVIRDRFPVRGQTTPHQINRAAFGAVARAVASDLPFPARARPARILADQVIWVTTPVRFDLAGGWSDTPPICQELGGAVVNAAITLNGQYPVQVMARLSERACIRLSSVDLGRSVTYATSARLYDASNPHDWAALAKAALVLSGIAPASPRESLPARLKSLGGGIDLTMFSALPKGSGLGTSSVLGAAILAALDRLRGGAIDHASLIRRTSLLEQMMSTAGGWQDQAGGITPGVKLLRTQPGRDQLPSIEPIAFEVTEDGRPAGRFADRLLLYYTGQRRLARDILQNVVARYLARDRAVIDIIHRLKSGALAMRHAIESRDADAFAAAVASYWNLKKGLDPGSTNPGIEAILDAVKPDLAAAELPGAGGGGFILMIARDARAGARIRERLTRRPPNSLARFYEFAIDPKGLSVSVL
ncbi:MAG: hypothetical protein IT436_06265 [Phycisphaerales bacterium]|nr:hypothetical protein [Phycisphaerales bacterium]